MAVIRNAQSRQRPWYSKRSYLASVWRGSLRVSGWPRQRNIHPTARHAQNMRWIAQVTATIKRMIPREMLPMFTAVTKHNRQVRGQQGTAAVRYEDVETMRMSGRFLAFDRPQMPTVVSFAVFEDQSGTLDWISDTPGTLLVRGKRSWGAAVPCQTGHRFTIPEDPDSADNCPLQYRYMQDI